MILIYILEQKFQNVKFFPLQIGTFVPKCKLFPFTNWNFLFSSLEKIFSRPNSGPDFQENSFSQIFFQENSPEKKNLDKKLNF